MSPTATAALGDRGASPASPGGLLDALLAAIAPADEEVSDLRIGSFLTAVVSRGCGLASPLAAQWSRLGAEPVRRAGALLPARVAELCPLVHSDNPLEASLGLAALNSLLSPEPEQWVEGKSHELLAELARGRRVAVVGHFPFVERLRPLTDRLWCFELPGRQLPSDLGPEAMDELLPQADLAAISATTMLNHTLEAILARLRPDCFRLLLGPSTPLSPILLAHGLDAIGGALVDDPRAALLAVSQGASFKQLPGVRLVTMLRCPGRDGRAARTRNEP